MDKPISDFEVVQAMERIGGSFIQALAVCFQKADSDNIAKLKAAFPDYWDEYTRVAAYIRKGWEKSMTEKETIDDGDVLKPEER